MSILINKDTRVICQGFKYCPSIDPLVGGHGKNIIDDILRHLGFLWLLLMKMDFLGFGHGKQFSYLYYRLSLIRAKMVGPTGDFSMNSGTAKIFC